MECGYKLLKVAVLKGGAGAGVAVPVTVMVGVGVSIPCGVNTLCTTCPNSPIVPRSSWLKKICSPAPFPVRISTWFSPQLVGAAGDHPAFEFDLPIHRDPHPGPPDGHIDLPATQGAGGKGDSLGRLCFSDYRWLCPGTSTGPSVAAGEGSRSGMG